MEKKTGGALAAREFAAKPLTVTFTGALAVRAKELTAGKMALSDEATRLATIGGRIR